MGKEKKIAKAEKDIRDYYEKLSISIGDKEKSAEYLNEILDIAIKFDTKDRYKISNLVKEWGYQRIEVMKKIKSDLEYDFNKKQQNLKDQLAAGKKLRPQEVKNLENIQNKLEIQTTKCNFMENQVENLVYTLQLGKSIDKELKEQRIQAGTQIREQEKQTAQIDTVGGIFGDSDTDLDKLGLTSETETTTSTKKEKEEVDPERLKKLGVL